MRAVEFSTWLSALGGMSAEQRRQGLQALTKADGEAGASGEGTRLSERRSTVRPSRYHLSQTSSIGQRASALPRPTTTPPRAVP
jgi:hypothetical protein